MPKNKFYVVWSGRKPGVYSDWDHCKAHDDYEKYLKKDLNAPKKIVCSDPLIGTPIPDSLSVDAACKGNPGILEYRGVDTKSGAEFFHKGPFPEGTVNLGEFLAIVHALALLKKIGSCWPVYSDSRTAIAWVKAKAIKTNLRRTAKNEELFDLVDRAVDWLRNNTWDNRILKWETQYWGEIPADFGRK